MKFKYTLQLEDFLYFQLFTISKTNFINSKRNKEWIFLTIGFSILTFYYFSEENTTLSIYFGLLTALVGFFYPRYFLWRTKKRYTRFIAKNYASRIDEEIELEFTESILITKNSLGDTGELNYSEINEINETLNHFFINTTIGTSIIIPKYKLNDENKLRDKFNSLQIQLTDNSNWKW